jgi:addiction module HigA family antidote
MAEPTTTTEIRDLSSPGDILAEALEERGLSNADLARRTELSEKHISQLVNARVPLSLDVALKLQQVLGIPASLWMSLESSYRAQQKRTALRDEYKTFGAWLSCFPVREMMRCDYLPDAGTDPGARVEALLTFFGLTSPDAWQAEWSQVTARFRASSGFKPDQFALTAWLRRSEIEAQAIRCSPFDRSRFLAILEDVRKLTSSPPQEFQPKLVEQCATAGVAVTFVPSLPKLAISGVTRWFGPERAAISLSLRYKTDDQLWFSFFHEACHALEHKTTAIYLDAQGDPDKDPVERRANEYARDLLIPPRDYERLVAAGKPTLGAVQTFAKQIGISPGIVVGRLQHEGVLPHNFGNQLKRKLQWSFES